MRGRTASARNVFAMWQSVVMPLPVPVASQSRLRRGPAMLRLTLLVVLLTHHIRTAYVSDSPSFADRLDKLYEKLEKLTISPIGNVHAKRVITAEEKLYAKLDKLNSLSPEKEFKDLTDEDEEMLSAMQVWGMLSEEQMRGVVRELHRMKNDERSERITDGEYGDAEWGDEDLQDLGEGDYPMDANEDWDSDYVEGSTAKPAVVTPSAFTRLDAFREQVVSAIDPIAATNERPRILDDSGLTPFERSSVLQATLAHIGTVVRAGKCLTPQARWLSVRQLAPAASTVYMPPCVQLHRCAPDSGCCYDESEVCAPVDGKYVTIPFYLNKADGNLTVARMVFFNHTRCACVSRDTLQSTVRTRVEKHHDSVRREREEWKSTEEPRLERDEEPTSAPQLRRCTCPALFLAKMNDSGCSCVCDWPDPNRRRDCLSLARGREHFGLRDRVCVINGDCTYPTCEYGSYERSSGRCPMRRFRRVRYHHRRPKQIV